MSHLPVRESDKLRLFVVDEQDRPRSQCWYFTSEGNDVYGGPEKTGHALKLSFHDNNGRARDGRNSQWGLTGPYAKMETQFGTPKLPPLARWIRPETPSVGVAHVASVMFPTDFLNGAIPAFRPRRARIAVPLAAPGQAIQVGLFYSRAAPAAIKAELDSATGKCLGYFSLPSAEKVAVAARVVPFDPALIPSASDAVRHALRGAPKADEVIANCSGVLLLEIPADGQAITLAEINGVTVKGRP